ncbi:hypothetical protein [Streptomyces sp. SPB162]|uniref:hypothetical protein n=1 Tax=Streptomyces sp. SPB162 TaxID=2940560 RepID=UPI002404EE00|nr:hypothetical protein [Streptomyces sp. SPB162]
MVAHTVAYQALGWHLTGTGHLFDGRVDVAAARATRRRFAVGSVVYPTTVGLAFLSAPLTPAVHGLLAVYYAFHQVPVPTREQAPVVAGADG